MTKKTVEKVDTAALDEEGLSNNDKDDMDVDHSFKRGKTPDYDTRHLLKWIGLKKLKKNGVNDISAVDVNNKLDPSYRVSFTLKNDSGVPTRVVHGSIDK